MTAVATAFQQSQPVTSVTVLIDIVAALRAAWSEYQPAEKTGIAFGQRLYGLRAASKVVQGGTTFTSSLQKAGIPRRTAYYWIARYEESEGLKRDISQIDKPAPARCVFESLITVLYSLTTSGNDGVEHKFVTLLEDARAYLAANPTLDEGAASSRHTIVYLLNRLSKEFQQHAATLSQNAELVQ